MVGNYDENDDGKINDNDDDSDESKGMALGLSLI